MFEQGQIRLDQITSEDHQTAGDISGDEKCISCNFYPGVIKTFEFHQMSGI